MKVIVKGAAQGIGRAIALKIAKDYQGAKLLLTDLNIACQSTLVAGKSMPCGIESQSGCIHHYGIGLGHTPNTSWWCLLIKQSSCIDVGKTNGR